MESNCYDGIIKQIRELMPNLETYKQTADRLLKNYKPGQDPSEVLINHYLERFLNSESEDSNYIMNSPQIISILDQDDAYKKPIDAVDTQIDILDALLGLKPDQFKNTCGCREDSCSTQPKLSPNDQKFVLNYKELLELKNSFYNSIIESTSKILKSSEDLTNKDLRNEIYREVFKDKIAFECYFGVDTLIDFMELTEMQPKVNAEKMNGITQEDIRTYITNKIEFVKQRANEIYDVPYVQKRVFDAEIVKPVSVNKKPFKWLLYGLTKK